MAPTERAQSIIAKCASPFLIPQPQSEAHCCRALTMLTVLTVFSALVVRLFGRGGNKYTLTAADAKILVLRVTNL
jgi:hypothetical protein